MKITVCFHLEAQLEALLEADWASAQSGQVDLRFAPVGYNCFEESALEMALQLRGCLQSQGEQVELSALSLGDRRVHRQMKTLYAVGYDRCVWMEDLATDCRFAPELVAEALADELALQQPDLVLVGQRGTVGGSGQTGALMAERLGYGYLGSVCELRWEQGRLAVRQQNGDYRVGWEVTQPTVLAIGNAPMTCLRVPTLRDRMGTKDKTIVCRSTPPPSVSPVLGLVSLQQVNRTRMGRILPQQSNEELAAMVYRILTGREEEP